MLTIGPITLFHGTIDAVRCNTGQKCAVVWRFANREVWLDEVAVSGRKRALYEWHKSRPSQRVLNLLARLEGEAADTIEAQRREAENALIAETFGMDEYEDHDDCEVGTGCGALCPWRLDSETANAVIL
jgi:hypothetical protein